MSSTAPAPATGIAGSGFARTLPADIHAIFEAQRHASRQHLDVPLLVRRERLLRLGKLLDEHGATLAAAVQTDFGIRSPRVTELADLLPLRQQLAHALRHLPRWMKPRKVRTPLALQAAQAWVQPQPLGVVGVIAPWNYPVQLALAPVITALAAGNRVILKPSELAPHTSAQLAHWVARFFAPDEFCVVQGDSATAALLASLPLDHLVFTGSTTVGRKVAQAAAANLTPTTLELGGKSPCLIDADADLADAALKIAHGKLLNAGQTCIAPDYVLLPRGQEAAFAQAYQAAVLRLYPSFTGNPDYTAIITPRHLARLRNLLQQAQQLGAQVLAIEGAATNTPEPSLQNRLGDGSARQMPPTLVMGVTSDMQLMQEEIFGPILPVVAYDRLDDAITHINHGPRPLAMYWFGHGAAARDKVLYSTLSGGITINDTLLHAAHSGLPFGGVGDSGSGTCRGQSGFDRLSHQRAVLVQSRWSAVPWLYPPYGARFDRLLGWLQRWHAR
jgi:coniferyl-aldehyde dehydrogenase